MTKSSNDVVVGSLSRLSPSGRIALVAVVEVHALFGGHKDLVWLFVDGTAIKNPHHSAENGVDGTAIKNPHHSAENGCGQFVWNRSDQQRCFNRRVAVAIISAVC